MRIQFGFLLATGLLIAARAACAQSGDFAVMVNPGQSYQRCMDLTYAEPVNYRFEASAPMNFDIRTLVSDQVQRAVARPGVMKISLSFRAPLAQNWCWTWTNASGGSARLMGSVTRLIAAP